MLVRIDIGKTLHKRAAYLAERAGVPLERWLRDAIAAAVGAGPSNTERLVKKLVQKKGGA